MIHSDDHATPLEQTMPTVKAPRAEVRGARCLKPKLVAEIACTEMINEGTLRHPSYLGLRVDKKPEAVAIPTNFTAALPKVQRKGRIFVDYLRNQRGATVVVPYAVRARENAPMAVPITWKETEAIIVPNPFRIGDAAELLKRAESKALSGWGRADQTLPDL